MKTGNYSPRNRDLLTQIRSAIGERYTIGRYRPEHTSFAKEYGFIVNFSWTRQRQKAGTTRFAHSFWTSNNINLTNRSGKYLHVSGDRLAER